MGNATLYHHVSDKVMVGWTPETAAWNVDLDHHTRWITAGYQNEFTCHFGRSTLNPGSGVACGSTGSMGIYVNYSGFGTVGPLDQNNACTLGGDSGGPVIDGNYLVGFTSGGTGTCTSGHTMVFQEAPTAAGTLGGLTIATTG